MNILVNNFLDLPKLINKKKYNLVLKEGADFVESLFTDNTICLKDDKIFFKFSEEIHTKYHLSEISAELTLKLKSRLFAKGFDKNKYLIYKYKFIEYSIDDCIFGVACDVVFNTNDHKKSIEFILNLEKEFEEERKILCNNLRFDVEHR